MKTRFSRSRDSLRMTASVSSSHPFPLCEPALCAATVNVALSRSTPCFAQRSRSPVLFLSGWPRSLSISLYIFCSDGGRFTPSFTAKHKPFACPAPWYGSCPRITTSALSNGHSSKARKIFLGGGYTIECWYSPLTNSRKFLKYSCPNSSLRASFHELSILTPLEVLSSISNVDSCATIITICLKFHTRASNGANVLRICPDHIQTLDSQCAIATAFFGRLFCK